MQISPTYHQVIDETFRQQVAIKAVTGKLPEVIRWVQLASSFHLPLAFSEMSFQHLEETIFKHREIRDGLYQLMSHLKYNLAVAGLSIEDLIECAIQIGQIRNDKRDQIESQLDLSFISAGQQLYDEAYQSVMDARRFILMEYEWYFALILIQLYTHLFILGDKALTPLPVHTPNESRYEE